MKAIITLLLMISPALSHGGADDSWLKGKWVCQKENRFFDIKDTADRVWEICWDWNDFTNNPDKCLDHLVNQDWHYDSPFRCLDTYDANELKSTCIESTWGYEYLESYVKIDENQIRIKFEGRGPLMDGICQRTD